MIGKQRSIFFQKISEIWGKLTIDRFANNENTKTEKFNSKYWCPSTFNVNAFRVSWSGENNYLVPPIYLIPRVIVQIKRSSSEGVLVLPYWPFAAYWPLIATSKTNFLPFVTDHRIFDNPSQCFSLGNSKKSLIVSSNFNNPVLALQFSS